MSIAFLLGFSTSRVESLGLMNSQSPKKIVFIGDSVTAKQRGVGYSYVSTLAERDYWNENTLINSARANNAIRDYYQNNNQINTHIIDHNPDWLCIALGLADAAFYYNQSQFRIEYRWLVDKVLEELPNITIILMRFTWTATLSIHVMEAHLSVIDDIAKDLDLIKVDLYNHTFNRRDLLNEDGAHPNEKGITVIADVIFNTLTPILDPNYVPLTSTKPSSASQTNNATSFPLIAIYFAITIINCKRRKLE